jgi:hypothetical protein
MATKKSKNDGPVGLTLYFEGAKFIAKLVKRVSGRRYTQVASIIEGAFNDVFGTVTHVDGSTSWSNRLTTQDEAQEVVKRLRNYGEVLSIVYNGAPKTHQKAAEKLPPKLARTAKGDRLAVEILKKALHGDGLVLGLDGEIQDADKSINNLTKSLEDAKNRKAGLEAKRDSLKATIERMGG